MNKRDRSYSINSVKVDTSQARSNAEVVRICLQELGWRECFASSAQDSDIIWNAMTFLDGNRNLHNTSALLNKFPGMCDLMRKVNLTRSLNVMRALFPDEYDFYPRTWFLPEQAEKFQEDAHAIQEEDRHWRRSLTTFIVKPSDGSQGEGIYLIRDPNHRRPTDRLHVIQEYIDRPLLIDGLKFDIRIYVLILQLDPLEIFLYNEGLARFATMNYEAPTIANLHETFMHLTNYSLNKQNGNYKHATSPQQNDASKRKLSLVWLQLREKFSINKIDSAKRSIIDMCIKTVIAILPELRVQYAMEFPTSYQQNRCFQIIGFDIMLTDTLQPILLEVNANPSLRIDFGDSTGIGRSINRPSPIDEDIKKPLVLETLRLAIGRRNELETTHKTIAHHKSIANRSHITQHTDKRIKRTVSYKPEHKKSDDLVPAITDLTNSIESKITSETTKSTECTKSTLQNNERLLQDTDDSTDSDESGIDTVEDYLKSSSNIQLANAVFKKQSFQPSFDQLSITDNSLMISSMKSLKRIFPSTDYMRYEQMFLLEKIAFIYIELAIRRGHNAMTSRQFREFAHLCNIINNKITMPSIDMLYTQIVHKWKQNRLPSTVKGLTFPGFVEAFFILSQRRSLSDSLLKSITDLVNTCMEHLKLFTEESV